MSTERACNIPDTPVSEEAIEQACKIVQQILNNTRPRALPTPRAAFNEDLFELSELVHQPTPSAGNDELIFDDLDLEAVADQIDALVERLAPPQEEQRPSPPATVVPLSHLEVKPAESPKYFEGGKRCIRVPWINIDRVVNSKYRSFKGDTQRTHCLRVAGDAKYCQLLALSDRSKYTAFMSLLYDAHPRNVWLSNNIGPDVDRAAWIDFDWSKAPQITAEMKKKAVGFYCFLWAKCLNVPIKHLSALNPQNGNCHIKTCVRLKPEYRFSIRTPVGFDDTGALVFEQQEHLFSSRDLLSVIVEKLRTKMTKEYPSIPDSVWRKAIDCSTAVRNLWVAKIESDGAYNPYSFYVPAQMFEADAVDGATFESGSVGEKMPNARVFAEKNWEYDLINVVDCPELFSALDDVDHEFLLDLVRQAFEKWLKREQLKNIRYHEPTASYPCAHMLGEEVFVNGLPRKLDWNLKLAKCVLKLYPTHKLDTYWSWVNFLRQMKSLVYILPESSNEDQVYKLFDELCSQADGYNAERNREFWVREKIEVKGFQRIIDTVVRHNPGKFRCGDSDTAKRFAKFEKAKPKLRLENHDATRFCVKDISERDDLFDVTKSVIGVCSGMGTGKTQGLRKKIKEDDRKADEAGLPRPKYIMPTAKISLAEAFYANYADLGFELYSNLPKKQRITADRIIIQMESLHRIDRRGVSYDVLILDESELITQQLNSPNFKRATSTAAVYKALMTHTPRVICCDALMSDLTINTLKRFGRKADDMQIWHNTFQNDTQLKTLIAQSETQLIQGLKDALLAGKNCIVPCSTKYCVKLIEHLGKTWINADKVLAIHGDSPDEKKRTISQINEEWSKYQLVVYNNTV
jgi:hypothetical protein